MHKHSCKPNLSDAANYCFKEYGLEVSEEILAESSTIEVDAASDEIAAKVPKEAWENTGAKFERLPFFLS